MILTEIFHFVNIQKLIQKYFFRIIDRICFLFPC